MYIPLLRVIVMVLVAQLTAVISKAQDNTLPWPTKLTWTDFKGPVDQASSFTAETKTWVNFHYQSDRDGKVICNLKCVFQPDRSWKRSERNLTANLLQHEQGHFNISEVFTRKMRKTLSEYCSNHKYCATTDNELKAIFNKILDESHAFQIQYDAETDHSKIAAKQEEWNNKISTMLKELAPYAQP